MTLSFAEVAPFKEWLAEQNPRGLPWACEHGSSICFACAEKMHDRWRRETDPAAQPEALAMLSESDR